MSDVDQEPSDDELFNEAISDEAPDAPVVAEQVEQPARDDAGRFAKKDDAESEAVAKAPVEKPAADAKPTSDEAGIPPWRVREINEEKRAALAELETLRAERAQWQQRPKQEQPKVERPTRPDPLLDPDGYADAIRNELREESMTERRNDSMAKALEDHPEDFKQAFKAATENGVVPELKARMNSARDPGKELLAWHREQKVKAEVGADPNAWLEKKLEERLNDPAFLQKAIERSKGASQQPDGRPRVELPPSLNGASRSNASLKSSNDDVSDDELFRELAG